MLTALLLAGGLLLPALADAADHDCTRVEATSGLCSQAANNGDEVDAESWWRQLADEGAADPTGLNTSDHAPGVVYDPNTGMPCDAPSGVCVSQGLPAEPADPGFPAVTLADLASFRPIAPRLTGEPAGFGVVGLPTNFVGGASDHQVPGALLGYPVTVRFVPSAYVFSYGDGVTQRAASGGMTWTQTGAAQFTPTGTSHTYRARGTFTSTVSVEYEPYVDFGPGWWRVDGVVTSTSAAYPVQVLEARTALVERTCTEDPRAAGC